METITRIGEVIAVIPEFNQAIVDSQGYHYSIGRKVQSFDWSVLKEGHMVEFTAYKHLPIVVSVIRYGDHL